MQGVGGRVKLIVRDLWKTHGFVLKFAVVPPSLLRARSAPRQSWNAIKAFEVVHFGNHSICARASRPRDLQRLRESFGRRIFLVNRAIALQ